ncbi:hypothetical protein PPTG_13807 [Phytophthora nicotianae INRA-310]|uniref:VWFA domain-containing protein n=1 Tax=Phytophthora nicotianae (strain INRA-310) TaxID=761204 RepID=W2Q0B3_PHYN3|nr:hypothetical protein PPTG_13807 [Phytophthora nicotianae INRA-310]ETN05959.1 hypothetical protein PPTG_13807 [Phytophthora nicotianae INRA-310]
MGKRKLLKLSCRIGWCSHDGECHTVFEDNVELLKRRLAAVEREATQMEHFSVIRSEMESRIQKVAKEIQLSYATTSTLELVIVMDYTGSMGPWNAEAKTAIMSIIDNVKKDHPLSRNLISSLKAFGGGDGPEDMPGELEAALAMPFEAEARRIVLEEFDKAKSHDR